MAATLRLLITNDDGISAAGLVALEAAAHAHGGFEVWVVAPDRERSTCSHGMTLTRHLRSLAVDPRRFAVDGLPADCVYLALFGLMPERPHVVISGINRGANLGSDVLYSGTVAGAREAFSRGIPAVAASLVQGHDFAPAARSVISVAENLVRSKAGPLLVNLNYPAGDFDGPRLASLGRRRYPERVTTRIAADGVPEHLLGGGEVEDLEVTGSDGWLVARGTASATVLSLDQTDARIHSRLIRRCDFLPRS